MLGPSGIAYTGAGLTPEDATRGILLPAGDQMVALISATTVDGDFVNDQLPTAADERPADLPAEETWQFEQRTFGFGVAGQPGLHRDGPPPRRRCVACLHRDRAGPQRRARR